MSTEHDRDIVHWLMESRAQMAAIDRLALKFGAGMQLHLLDDADLEAMGSAFVASAGIRPGDVLARPPHDHDPLDACFVTQDGRIVTSADVTGDPA